MWVASLLTLIVLAGVLYIYLRSSGTVVGSPRTVELVGAIRNAREPSSFKGEVPLSFNEKEGLTFSYSAWVLIEDWMYRQGALKTMFVKGSADSKTQCPGVHLDATSNTMLVKLDTYGDTETIEIPNLPARKWIHLAIVVDQDSVDVYIDSILRVHHSLLKLPRQTTGPVFIAPQGGWAGQIGSLIYHKYALTPGEIVSLMGTAPYEDSTKSKIPLPPYFDTTWYIGRF